MSAKRTGETKKNHSLPILILKQKCRDSSLNDVKWVDNCKKERIKPEMFDFKKERIKYKKIISTKNFTPKMKKNIIRRERKK